jgi:hypothetical protein
MWITERVVWGSTDGVEDRMEATRHIERLPR